MAKGERKPGKCKAWVRSGLSFGGRYCYRDARENGYCAGHDPVKLKAKIDTKERDYMAAMNRQIEEQKRTGAALRLCEGVSTEELERLGTGWLACIQQTEKED